MPSSIPEIKTYASKRECQRFPHGPFLGVKVERYDRYDILWFVWERDGLIPKQIIPQDWEPVIFFRKNESLVKITVRRHFEWHDYYSTGNDVPIFSIPISIIFSGSHHAPLVRNNYDSSFDELLDRHEPLLFDFEHISTVPPYARRAIFNRRGLYVQRGDDIYERARESLIELDS
ncbi:MAG: hypothetical protein ACYCPW_05690 [Nitrososphaerales archaeon]